MNIVILHIEVSSPLTRRKKKSRFSLLSKQANCIVLFENKLSVCVLLDVCWCEVFYWKGMKETQDQIKTSRIKWTTMLKRENIKLRQKAEGKKRYSAF